MDSLGAPSNFLVQCFQLLIQPDGQFLGGLLYANVLYHEDANACHGLDYMRTSHGGQAVSDTHTHTHTRAACMVVFCMRTYYTMKMPMHAMVQTMCEHAKTMSFRIDL